MDILQFAFCIVLPGAGSADIVSAAIKHSVHIIDKENYNADRDYAVITETYLPLVNGERLFLLFVFPVGESILANTPEAFNQAKEWIQTSILTQNN